MPFYRLLLILILLAPCLIFTQELDRSFEFLPGSNSFPSLQGSIYEPRFGVLYSPDDQSLEVSIGNSFDALKFNFADSSFLTLGLDFFAYARVTDYKEFRLQVSAVDGLFGGNINYSFKLFNSQNHIRLRFIHHSAHLVDGSYDSSSDNWIDGKKPVPYARDFIDLTFLNHRKTCNISFLSYFTTAYSFLLRPVGQKKVFFRSGISLYYYTPFLNIKNKKAFTFFSYDFLLNGLDSYRGNNELQLGVRFGEIEHTGLLVFFSYFNGANIYGAYYKENLQKIGAGFSIDF